MPADKLYTESEMQAALAAMVEKCAGVVDECNREGPYQAIAAACILSSQKRAERFADLYEAEIELREKAETALAEAQKEIADLRGIDKACDAANDHVIKLLADNNALQGALRWAMANVHTHFDYWIEPKPFGEIVNVEVCIGCEEKGPKRENIQHKPDCPYASATARLEGK